MNSEKTTISGWSNTNFSSSIVVVPENTLSVSSTIKEAGASGEKILARGAGLSYGDQALNDSHTVLDMRRMNRVLEWDAENGIMKLESGAKFEKILVHCLKDGWIIPVVPGTRYVTIGGAIANNVHGKNNLKYGGFGECVRELKIVLASGEVLSCSRENNREIFFGTIGGMGLLGVVTEVTLKLIRVPSPNLAVKKVTAPDLKSVLENLDQMAQKNDFAIAQLDCFPQGKLLGRGTLHSGNFISSNNIPENLEDLRKITPRIFGIIPKKLIPLFGKYILNDITMSLVSRGKYYLDKFTADKDSHEQNFFQFTFFLDQVPYWKKVFRHGFFEYQPLIPKEKALVTITKLIALTHKFAMPAYLSAIKTHRKDDFLLSYSMNGYSFAMDIPRKPRKKGKQDELFREMNKVVIDAGGIIYLAKDASLNTSEFRQMYKNADKFLELKKKYDPEELFQSDMYRRLFKNNK